MVTITETAKGKTTAARTITRRHARTLISARTRTWFASWRRYTPPQNVTVTFLTLRKRR